MPVNLIYQLGLSSFNEGEGTLVQERKNIMERPIVSGISSIDSEAKLTIRGVPDIPGVAAKILSPSDAGIEVDVIVQILGLITPLTLHLPSMKMIQNRLRRF